MIEGESGVLAVSPPWDLGASGGESPPGDSTRVVLGAGYQSDHVRQSPGGDCCTSLLHHLHSHFRARCC